MAVFFREIFYLDDGKNGESKKLEGGRRKAEVKFASALRDSGVKRKVTGSGRNYGREEARKKS